MERVYFYAPAVGKREVVVQRVRRVVMNAGMAQRIPLVKIERGAKRQFYLFLAVELADGLSNTPTRDVLLDGVAGRVVRIPLEIFNTFQRTGLRFEETALQPGKIAAMVQRDNIEIHGFDELPYQPRVRDDELADSLEEPDGRRSERFPEGCASCEHMLYWMSASVEGSWRTFKRAAEILVPDSARKGAARSIMRRLGLLGHVDLSGDGARWSISPTSLVRFPDDPTRGFLAGQRTMSLLRELASVRPLRKTDQPADAGPPRMDMTTDVSDGKGPAETGLIDAGVTSDRLADLLPDLEGWKESLQRVARFPTAAYTFEKWHVDGFRPSETLYDRAGEYYGESGMYRVYRHGNGLDRGVTLYFDELGQRWIKGDWYGLRFLAVAAGSDRVEAIYDSTRKELLVRESQRWPLLYERALTLASGLLPAIAQGGGWLRYPRMTVKLVRQLCRKLNVTLREE